LSSGTFASRYGALVGVGLLILVIAVAVVVGVMLGGGKS